MGIDVTQRNSNLGMSGEYIGVKENLWPHNSQISFLLYLIHWVKHSWWMYLMDPVQMHGKKSGRSENHRYAR